MLLTLLSNQSEAQPIPETVTRGGFYSIDALKRYLRKLRKLETAVNQDDAEAYNETQQEIEALPEVVADVIEPVKQRLSAPKAITVDYSGTIQLAAQITAQINYVNYLLSVAKYQEKLRAEMLADEEEALILLM